MKTVLQNAKMKTIDQVNIILSRPELARSLNKI